MTARGSRYHRRTSCQGLRDGQLKAIRDGHGNHPVQRTTEVAALAEGKTPCSRCLEDQTHSMSPQWRTFMAEHASVLSDSPFEREFVARVLSHVSGLRPEDVQPQQAFVDSTGRNRRIDFAVLRGGLRLAIEVDGAQKVQGDLGSAGSRLDDALQRQNDLVAAGWKPLRFSNAQVMSESARCARTIGEHLQAAAAGTGSPQGKELEDVPAARPPLSAEHGPTQGRPRGLHVIGGVLAVAALIGAVALGNRGPERVSDAEQRRLDVANGAVPPVDDRNCPGEFDVKANYNVDRSTRYLFVPADGRFYESTKPTSCWASEAAAVEGGYERPPAARR